MRKHFVWSSSLRWAAMENILKSARSSAHSTETCCKAFFVLQNRAIFDTVFRTAASALTAVSPAAATVRQLLGVHRTTLSIRLNQSRFYIARPKTVNIKPYCFYNANRRWSQEASSNTISLRLRELNRVSIRYWAIVRSLYAFNPSKDSFLRGLHGRQPNRLTVRLPYFFAQNQSEIPAKNKN